MDTVMMPTDFNPWNQTIVLYNSDGSNATVTVEDFNMLRIYAARLGINYGSQIGASLVLLLILILLTRAEKRKSSIFIVNALCLLANAIRCILFSCYATSAMMHPYTLLSGDYTHVKHKDLSIFVATNIFTLIVTVLVMVSLSLQVWVVCVTTMPVHRIVIMGVTTIVACVAVGYKMAFVILTIKQTLNWESMMPYKYLISISYIMQAVAIWLYSCVFTYKLGHAIIQRRKLNMPQFGPMQIVFIMGCQTMLIPGIPSCHIRSTHHSLTCPSHLLVPSIPRRPSRARRPSPHRRLHLPSSLRHLGRRRQRESRRHARTEFASPAHPR
tara:strand:+ start:4938 stop:5918 length:981 start_codon:yes stop_codon:yes gene_type:complete